MIELGEDNPPSYQETVKQEDRSADDDETQNKSTTLLSSVATCTEIS